MAVKSRGRGTAAVIGLCCLLVGLVGGVVLFIVAERRPLTNVEGFARAPVGCITTLEFSEEGTFYVFEEAGGSNEDNGCEPVADATTPFGVEFTGDLMPESTDETTELSYDVGGFDGRSVRSVEITEPGQYTVEVTGDDPTVVAAIGRDPEQGVDELRRAALFLAGAGIVVGLALLTLSGRRSKRAAVATTPSGPGWGPASRAGAGPSTAGGPLTGQVPVNPHARPEPGQAPAWQPPTGGAADLDAPEPSELPPPPPPTPPQPTSDAPVLPDAPGRPSGT
jgi:hypothetical protein